MVWRRDRGRDGETFRDLVPPVPFLPRIVQSLAQHLIFALQSPCFTRFFRCCGSSHDPRSKWFICNGREYAVQLGRVYGPGSVVTLHP